MKLVGVFHVHSSYSHDGRHSLRELAEIFRTQDIDFCILTDHLCDHDHQSFQQFLEEVEEINNEGGFVFIPGAEAEFDGAHIVAFPLNAMPDVTAIERYCTGEDCMRVLAHPSKMHLTEIEGLLSRLDGYELWNQWADGNGLPSFSFVRRAADSPIFSNKLVFWGTDMHDGSMPACNRLEVEVPGDTCDINTIVSRLRSGEFVNVNVKSGLAMEAGQPVSVLQEQISRKRSLVWCIQSAVYSALRGIFSVLGPLRKSRTVGFLKRQIKRRL